MTPTTGSFFEGNGFGVIACSDPSPRTLSSFTTRTIITAASRVKPPPSLSRSVGIVPFCLPQASHYLKWITSLTGPSLLSVSSEAIKNWISLENISKFLKTLSTLMSELKSLLACIKFKSILGMILLPLYRINYQDGFPQIPNTGYRCIDILSIQNRVIDVMAFTK
jgi:hypothetical protein